MVKSWINDLWCNENSVFLIAFHHSEGVRDTEVGRHVRMVPLVAREMGNVDPVALVSGSRAVAGGDSGGIDAFVSGSKVMSPAAVSCV